ncbi:hypothetical protein F4604DRAFT_1599758, partial [Suillus subluteus]
LLYTHPDYIYLESNLETSCHIRGFNVIFLSKYHCELNFYRNNFHCKNCNIKVMHSGIKNAIIQKEMKHLQGSQ